MNRLFRIVQNDAFFQFLKIFISYLTGDLDDLKKIKKSFLENMTCTICSKDIYIDAVIINCGHTFCKYCIMKWQRTSRKTPAEPNAKCPLCNMVITTLTPNMSARNHINELCEVFLDGTGKKEREKSIQEHSENIGQLLPIEIIFSDHIITDDEDIDELDSIIIDKQTLSNASGLSEITERALVRIQATSEAERGPLTMRSSQTQSSGKSGRYKSFIQS